MKTIRFEDLPLGAYFTTNLPCYGCSTFCKISGNKAVIIIDQCFGEMVNTVAASITR